MITEETLQDGLNRIFGAKRNVTIDTFMNYILVGCPTGSFSEAVICGDLFDAVMRADGENEPLIQSYALFFELYAPRSCFGSKEKYEAWINAGGLKGR